MPDQQQERMRRPSASRKARVLDDLRIATRYLKEFRHAHERAIAVAIEAGCSEREIGRAAGVSGVTIHNRKAKLRAVPDAWPLTLGECDYYARRLHDVDHVRGPMETCGQCREEREAIKRALEAGSTDAA